MIITFYPLIVKKSITWFIAQFRENTDGCASTESLREFHEVSYLYITHKSTSGMNWLCPLAFANGDARSWIPAMRSEQLHSFLDFSTIALRHKSLPSSETNIIIMTCQINTTLKTFLRIHSINCTSKPVSKCWTDFLKECTQNVCVKIYIPLKKTFNLKYAKTL